MSTNKCSATQVSDQMVCTPCGLVWDVNDHEPPQCGGTAQPVPQWPSASPNGEGLARIPMCDSLLPSKMTVGLYRTDDGYALVEETIVNNYEGMLYHFFNANGLPLRRVRVYSPYRHREVTYPVIKGRVWLCNWETL
jgi:hypothetical protein